MRGVKKNCGCAFAGIIILEGIWVYSYYIYFFYSKICSIVDKFNGLFFFSINRNITAVKTKQKRL